MISSNVEQIRNRVEQAEKQSELHESVRIVAVTKKRSIEEIKQIVESGIKDLGENRVQEFSEKYPHFGDDIRWHLIGTLQRNKVKYIIDKVYLIHSVDSIKLAEEIDRQAEKHGIKANVLIQVNVAQEESKHGFSVDEIDRVCEELSLLNNLNVQGMMMIAPNSDDPIYLENLFRKTRNIFDNMVKKCSKYDNIDLSILSMGMTNDFESAIEYGSNLVRIGRALFN